MTDQQGSDAQMSVEQAIEVQRRRELDQAAMLEEERKTAARPVDGDG